MGPFDEVYNRVADYLRIPRNTKKDQQGTCVTVLGIQIDSIGSSSASIKVVPRHIGRRSLSDRSESLARANRAPRRLISLLFKSCPARENKATVSIHLPSRFPT